ncbi:MAG: hypothetical protein WBA17_09080 [Saprospiraceae bacterium]
MSKQTPEQEAIAMFAEATEQMLPWLKPSTADSIGIHAIWVELLKRSPDLDIKVNATINVEEKRIEINLQSESSDLSIFVEGWLSKIEKIAYAPSGWELIIFLMGEPIKIRSVKFPKWHDGFGEE